MGRGRDRERGLHKVSAVTAWIAGAAVAGVGLFSAAFALPQLIDKAQAKTDDPGSSSSNPSGFSQPDPSGASSSGGPSGAYSEAPSNDGGLVPPPQPPVRSGRRSRARSGAS